MSCPVRYSPLRFYMSCMREPRVELPWFCVKDDQVGHRAVRRMCKRTWCSDQPPDQE
jgi:hypothetical protein